MIYNGFRFFGAGGRLVQVWHRASAVSTYNLAFRSCTTMEVTNFEELRTDLDDLRVRAETLLKRLGDIPDGEEKNASAKSSFDRFVSTVEELIDSCEADIGKIQERLKRFLDIVPPESVKTEFETFKDKLSKLLESGEPLCEVEKPYGLFVSLVEKHDLDIQHEDSITLDDEFGRKLTTPLYQGKYRFDNTKRSGDRDDEKNPNPTTEQGGLIPQIGSDVDKIEEEVIITHPPNVHFGANDFLNEYFSDGSQGKRIPLMGKRGELYLLGYFARIGALTKRQLKDYLSKVNIGMVDPHFDNLRKKGYISSLKCEGSDEFYALSPKGLKIFETDKSRKLMNAHRFISKESKALGYNSERNYIRSDVKAYEKTASVALKISSGCTDVRKNKVTRIHRPDKMASAIVLDLSLEGDVCVFSLQRTSGSEKVFFVPFQKTSESEKVFFVSFQEIPVKGGLLYCVVSDDHTIECFDSDDSKIDLDAFIKKLGRFKIGISEGEPDENVPIPDTTHTGAVKEITTVTDIPATDEAPVDVPSEDTGPLGNNATNTDEAESKEVIVETEDTDNDKVIDTQDDTSVIADNTINNENYMPEGLSPERMAEFLLNNNITPENADAFNKLVDSLLDAAADAKPEDNTDYIGRAVVLRKTLAIYDDNKYGEDYKRLLLATDMPLDERVYSSDELLSLFYDENEGRALHLAALVRALFRPSLSYDFRTLTDYAKELLKGYDSVFVFSKNGPDLKSVLNQFTQICPVLPEGGFTNAIIGQLIDENSEDDRVDKLKKSATDMGNLPNLMHFNGAPEMLKKCFGLSSELGKCMDAIANDKKSYKDFRRVYELLNNDANIDNFIKNAWEQVRQNNGGIKYPKLFDDAVKKIKREIKERWNVIKDWLEHIDGKSVDDNMKAVYAKVKDILDGKTGNEDGVKERLSKDTLLRKSERAVLLRVVENLSLMLKSKDTKPFVPEDWLAVGIFPVSEDKQLLPIINESFKDIGYYEPWRNILRHISYKPLELGNVLEQIIDDDDDRFCDNLGQALAICKYQSIDEKDYKNNEKGAKERADKKIQEFEEKSGLHWSYGRVSEQVRENVINTLDQFKAYFVDKKDFARLRAFIGALEKQLKDDTNQIEKRWEDEIERRKEGGVSDNDLNDAILHLKKKNFMLVEGAINDLDIGEKKPGQSDLNSNEDDLFSKFIDEYGSIERLCRENASKTLMSFAEGFVGRHLSDKSRIYRESAQTLLKSLPHASQQRDCEEKIGNLLTELGFTIVKDRNNNYGVRMENSKGAKHAIFTAEVEPEKKNSQSYKHPIAAFGTKLGKMLCIIELFDQLEPSSIVDIVRRIRIKELPLIVFLNGFLTIAQRRQLAMLFLKDGNNQREFVFVDWILLLHLASQSKEERIRVMLACAIPYTGAHQLFLAHSAISVADEMYIGRKEEIRQISAKNGPIIVYGGRQLGKTAVLIRARNLFHNPKNEYYGVYADCKECVNETLFVESLTKEIGKSDIVLPDSTSIMTIKSLCAELDKWLNKNKNRQLLLLIDESDKIFGALAKAKNLDAALIEFERLMRDTGQFKFVFAGLHKVCSIKHNNTAGHFGNPICIRPLSQSDAYKLLTRPLRFLGFKTDDDSIVRLLGNTVYYPGVVHFVGQEIVNILINDYSAHYKESENPPYQLEDGQIGAIMRSKDLSSKIAAQIRMTLEVDDSYYLLALCIALLYYLDEQNRSNGYTIKEILDCADAFDVGILKKMRDNDTECKNLLSELCEMSILFVKNDRYRFRLSRFLNIIGKDADAIENQIQIKQRNEQDRK
jgi:hypothetical protein